jgi:tRNA dimethylallyltransferase
VPIVCGGTGQYLSALADGLSFLSAAPDPDVRARLLAEAERWGNATLLARLASVDPETAARLHANDRKRIVRALEVLETTGRTVSDLNRASRAAPPDFAFRIAALSPDREVLYRRCDARVDRMIAMGLREEVAGLLGRGVPRSSQAMQAIGYKEMVAQLAGEISLDEAAERIRQATRRYAKRQITWLRAMENVHWVPVEDGESTERVAVRILGVFPEFLT